MPNSSMTLDQAIDAFHTNPVEETALSLINVAIEYWKDNMIADVTLAGYLTEIAAWLKEDL